MKKLILILMLLVSSGAVFGQQNAWQNTLNTDNSTSTALDSAGTFTGKPYPTEGYNTIIIVPYSNVASEVSGVEVQFGKKNTSTGVFTITSYAFASYTAGDSTTNRYVVPLAGEYFRVIYHNGATAQTTFSLQTFMSEAVSSITVSIGAVSVGAVTVTSSALPSGASTSAHQVTQNTKLDSLISDLAKVLVDADSSLVLETARNILLDAFADTNKVKWDAWLASDWATKTLQDSQRVDLANIIAKHFATYERQDSVIQHLSDLLLLDFATSAKQDSAEVTLNIIAAKDFATAEKQDSAEVTLNAIQVNTNTANTKLDSLDASSTRIEGYVDNVEAKLDSLDASSTRNELKLDDVNVGIDSLDASSTRIEGYVDNLEPKTDSLEVTLNAIQVLLSTTNTKLDTIEVSVNATNLALVEVNSGLDSLEVTGNAIQANQTNGNQITQLKSPSNFYALRDTSAADTTTVTFGFTSRHIGIKNDETGSVDSTTLFISTVNTFDADKTYQLLGGESLSLDFAATALYIKWGATTLYANKKCRFIVN